MRRRRPEKRTILPDPIYKDLVVAKFINYIMIGGKKSIAEKIFYNSLDIISSQLKMDTPIDVFKKAIANVSPMLEVKSKRIGGATYQVPIEVPRKRAFYLAALWIIRASNSSSGKPMAEKLANELIAAANGDGNAIKKKEDTHRMADANKAFAHFR